MICLNRTAEVMIRKGLVFVGKNKGKGLICLENC